MNKEAKQKNILGEDLELCSTDPLTGWYRDGCCNTDQNDNGTHTVCAKVNNNFLNWLKQNGNDLITPRPEYNFDGLKDGDCWCVCASWYARAVKAGFPCKVYIRSTNIKTLDLVDLDTLKKNA
ncbi:MAG: DUF2237 domain-containing protein, partial [Pelagibacteraceae bacterium]